MAVRKPDIHQQGLYFITFTNTHWLPLIRLTNSFDAVHCYTQKFILQKINYIHANPCSKKWMLADDITQYPHNSAKYYETSEQSIYPVTSWMQLEDKG